MEIWQVTNLITLTSLRLLQEQSLPNSITKQKLFSGAKLMGSNFM